MELKDYKRLIFFGAGKMAEYVYNQIGNAEERLVACIDSLKDEGRTLTSFKGVPVTSPYEYCEMVKTGDTAVVVCVFILNCVIYAIC